MAFLISPGVQVNEIDLTNVIPAAAASTAGYAGHFTWGPVGQLVTVSSEKDLVTNFGSPDASTAKSFLTAASFLKYGNNLKVSRAVDVAARNAAGAVGNALAVNSDDRQLVRNLDEYESFATPFTNAAITARYPGVAGDSIRVVIARSNGDTFNYTGPTTTTEDKAKAALSALLKSSFTSIPGSTPFAENYAINAGFTGGINDEIHVLVIDSKGAFTGIPGSVLERYEGLSLASDAKTETGATNYYKKVINTSSNYIYITSLSGVNVQEWVQADKPIAEVFSTTNGVTSAAPILSAGVQTLETDTFTYNDSYVTATGTAQVELVTATGNATAAGDVVVTVTSDGMAGSPLAVTVPIASGDTPTVYAVKVRDALTANTTIGGRFTVSGAAANIILTRKPDTTTVPGTTINLPNDDTLNIAITSGPAGVIAHPNSVTTEPGVSSNLVPHIITDILGSDGATYNLAITVKKQNGTAVGTVSGNTPVTVTITKVQTKTTSGVAIPVGNQSPVTAPSYDIVIGPGFGTDINYSLFAGFNVVIEINQSSNIVVTYPLYEEITTGGGYAPATIAGTQTVVLGGAVSGSLTSAASIVTALQYFADAETVDVNLLFSENFAQGSGTEYDDVAVVQKTIDAAINEITNARKDCIGFISAPLDMSTLFSDSDKKDLLVNKANNVVKSSYMVMDSSPVYVYNKYSDSYVWISAGGHMAGLCANTDRVADAWFSPAGFSRGSLLGVTKLAYNPNQVSRDDIYKLGVNPIVSFPGEGIILFGDKTLQSKPSAFDRINVRRLFITLEKAIATSSKFQLFEQNDRFTRASFVASVEPFLRTVQSRRGITDFKVVCDESNNTGDVIDNNRFVADIYIKPTRSINYITLNFVATRTGVAFTEIVG